MHLSRRPLRLLLALTLGWLLCVGLPAGRAHAQGVEAAGRPIAEIRVQGLDEVPEQLVRNQLRSRAGEPYDPQTVEGDIVRLTHLGRFSGVNARVTPLDDGSVVLTFEFDEQPLLADVLVAGNKAINDQKLLELVVLRAGDPADPFLIDRGRRQIIEAYEDKGYFVADVTVDEQLLNDSEILLYRIREGPKVRIRRIAFEGNEAFTDEQLESRIRSEEYFPILNQGELSREQLELDAGRIREFYQERGYLDAQVGRRIDLSPTQRDAVVTFLIDERRQYLVDSIRVEGNEKIPDEQIRLNLQIAEGDVFSQEKLRRSVEGLIDLYGKLGYLDTVIEEQRLYHPDQPRVDLVLTIDEGTPSTVGTVSVRGNQVTKSKVILRHVRGMQPGRPFDRTGVEETRRRISESPLFSEGTVTILGDPGDEVRDVLLEVKETNTGSLLFGAGVSSDAGVIGAIELTQRNFDITDVPESWDELRSGQAFRGAGQYFAISLQPGDETSRFSIDFRDPYVFESDYFLDASLFFFEREREDWDEGRIGGGLGVGQRFGDVWSAAVRGRVNQIDIDNIEPEAPVDVFAVEGDSLITGLGIELERNTTDSRLFPTRGSRLQLALERAGALGGDYDFTRATLDFYQFWTVDQDFFDRKTVLSWRLQAGHIFEDNEAPVFERFYAGGHRSFRGFDFRGVGPRGIRADTGTLGDDPVGGDWLLLTGLEYNFPVWEETLRGVLFTDMGTVQDDFGVDEWRVSIGAGVRIKIPFLGQAPFALDLAVPLIEEQGDEERLISFDLALPFR